jgi:hypothetical protein
MEISFDLIQTILSLLGGSGLLGGGTYLLNRYRNRIKVKLVSKINDPDLDDFIELYEDVLDENIRITPEEIKRFVGKHEPECNSTLCDFLFFCKRDDSLLGFLKTIYCHQTKILFIAYLGIDKTSDIARKHATNSMLSYLAKFIKKKLKDCEVVFFEVEQPKENAKKSKAIARLRLFRSAAERLKLFGHQISFNYVQPEMPTDVGSTSEEKTVLVFIPRNSPRKTQISKDDLEDV